MSSSSSVTIGDLIAAGEASIQTGPFGTQFKAAEYKVEGIPMINVKNIGFGSVRTNELERVGTDTRDRLSAHVVKAGDVVFGRKGAVERHAYIREDQDGWIQGSDCIRLRIRSKRFLPRYVSYALLTPTHQQWMINQCSHGATMASLNQDILKRIELRPISIVEQTRIVAILQGMDELIENNIRRIEILEQMALAIYREWFVNFRFPGHEDIELIHSDVRLLPQGWKLTTFGEVASERREGIDPDDVDPETAYVGLEHIPRQSIVLTEFGRASEVSSRKWRFERGDILFGKLRPYFHKVVRAPHDGICSTDAIVIDPLTGIREFALLVASSEEFVGHATATAGGTDRPRANWKDLAAYSLALPPAELLDSFQDFVRPLIGLMSQPRAAESQPASNPRHAPTQAHLRRDRRL